MSVPAHAPRRAELRPSSARVFIKVAVILLAWVAAFLAFLIAPILALVVAWIVGLGWAAVRNAGSAPGGPPVHRFGNGNGGDS